MANELKKFKLTPPYKPLLCEEAIEYFNSILNLDFKVFEYGSGGSTLWLGERVGSLISVEGYEDWYNEVKACIKTYEPFKAQLRYLIIPPHGPKSQVSRWDKHADAIKEYDDMSFDLVFVDGYHRTKCCDNAARKIKRLGWLVIDDTNWKFLDTYLQKFCDKWEHVKDIEGIKYGRADGKITSSKVSFFRRPETV